jgi:chemotaxis protein methyltransferase CheR
MDKIEERLLDIIESHSGLHVRGTHWDCVRLYIQKRMDELHMDSDVYCRYLTDTQAELSLVIDEAAINETYFFREERQFECLRDRVFPDYTETPMVIWSACCATGEEPVSLAVLARSCRIDAEVYASDIDTSALAILHEGMYNQCSFRSDGSRFHPLLEQYGEHEAGIYTVNNEILSSIHVSEYNLAGTAEEPVPEEGADLIFVRNVFIYFNKNTQNRIISRLSRCIRPGGYLFFSMNEIAGIDVSGSCIPLIKEHCGSVYFFRKVDADTLAACRKSRSVSVQETPVSCRPQRKKTEQHTPSVHASPAVNPKIPDATSRAEAVPVRSPGEQILAAVDRHDLRSARNMIAACSYGPAELEYRFYYSAVVSKEEGKTDEAAGLFLKASLLNHSFWPALLQLGLLYKEQGKEKDAVKAFSGCAKVLEKYIERQETCYNFLVESFSPSYFYTLCTDYVEKGKKHAV